MHKEYYTAPLLETLQAGPEIPLLKGSSGMHGKGFGVDDWDEGGESEGTL